MKTFDWNLIPSFLAALDHGSLAAASRDTGISQPTLGRHIDDLEKALGVILFQRGRAGMLPTVAGLELADLARDMRRASAAISLAATGASESVSGTVRITASNIVSSYILPPIFADLLRDLPEIEIELSPSDAVENLLQRDADIAIRMVRPQQNDLITRQVNTMEMGMYAHREYLKRAGVPRRPDVLNGHVIIGYDRSDLIIKGFAKGGLEVGRDFFRFRCDNQVAAQQALINGVGIGFSPNILARQQPNLIRLMPDLEIPSLQMWLTSHRELRTSRRIRQVNDYLGERLAALDLA